MCSSDLDPEINLASIAKNDLPQQPADNSLHTSTQHDDNGSSAATDGAHPGDLPVDVNQLPSFKLADDGGAHPGTVPHDPTAVTAPSSDSSGTHGPSAPALVKTLDVPDAGMSPTPDQFVFADNAGHGPGADHNRM